MDPQTLVIPLWMWISMISMLTAVALFLQTRNHKRTTIALGLILAANSVIGIATNSLTIFMYAMVGTLLGAIFACVYKRIGHKADAKTPSSSNPT
jgi:ribose/xylose/arabinose/galactoside ABC-type transport system permease subunit